MRLLRALGAVLVLAGLLLAVTSTATAQTLPPLVTDYDNYPDTDEAILTDGCDFTGVIGEAFSLNDGTPVDQLFLLPEMQAGDTVTMTWTGVAPECVGSAISLVIKVAREPGFNPDTDQLSGEGGYNVGTLTDGPGSLSLLMPDLFRFQLGCHYQLDAVVGVPLRDVGPSGSYFTAALRQIMGTGGADQRTTVFSFRNSTYELCVAQETTTTTTTSTTTTAPPPPSTAPPPSSPTTAAGQIAQTAQRTLAATGNTPWAALAGLAAVGFGVLLLVAGRRHSVATRRSS